MQLLVYELLLRRYTTRLLSVSAGAGPGGSSNEPGGGDFGKLRDRVKPGGGTGVNERH